MRQFAGVLAHEFGHFGQGAGMRLTYLIRAISFWFTRVVYERDAWDEWLANSTEGLDLRIAWVLYLAQFLVWLTRRVLWLLMLLGHMVAGYMLRQMEFDADRREAHLAGSDTFESTCRRLMVLGVANQGAHADLGSFYREGRLGDNLPKLVMVNVDQIPEEVRHRVDEALAESQTGLLDTHPCDRDRIASARQENAPGIFRLDRPAAQLFLHYEDLCKGVTWDFYRDIFGPQFQPSSMHPLDDLLQRQEAQQDAQKSLQRYFLGTFNVLRPLRLPTVYLTAPAAPKETVRRIQQLREQLRQLKPRHDEAFAAFDQADTAMLDGCGALALHDAGLPVRPDQFRSPLSTREDARRAIDAAKTQMGRTGSQLEPLEAAQGERLVCALQLLFVPQVAAKLPEAPAWQEESARLLPMAQALSRLLQKTAEVRNLRATLGLLFNQIQGNERNRDLLDAIGERAGSVKNLLLGFRQDVGGMTYPFDHAQGPLSLTQYLLSESLIVADLGGLYDGAGQWVDRLISLYVRIAGRLAEFAEQVETLIGLPPRETPKDGGTP